MNSSAIVPFRERGSGKERVTPQALEAEQSTLGAMLMERMAIVEAMEKITGEMFYRAFHQKIWDAIIHLHGKDTDVDLITVVEELRRRNQLDEIGGPAYLTALVESCPSSKSVTAYAQVVKDKFVLRQFLIASEKIKEDAYSTELSVEEITARAEKEIADLGRFQLTAEPHEIATLIEEQRARIIAAAQSPVGMTGVLSGFPDLDRLTSGFKPQELIVLAGASSMGKSALASQICTHILKTTCRPVITFSLEMSKESWLNRMVSTEARVVGHDLRNGRMLDDEWERVDMVQSELAKLPMHIVDTPGITTAEIKAQSRRIAAMHGTPALIMIDYLQIARLAEYMRDERVRVMRMVEQIKNLARQMDCPVLCLSQLNRALNTRENKRPTLADLRETSAIEAESDMVLFVYRPGYYKQKRADGGVDESEPDEIILAKQREGATAMVPVKFIGKYTRFESVTMEEYGYVNA